MKFLAPLALLACLLPAANAQAPLKPNVEFEMMTWAEIKQAQADGFINVIVYNGGTEQRGPQNISGGHTLMARETAHAIALKFGHTIVAPVLPYSVNNSAASSLPWGTIGLTGPQFATINEQVSEQLIKQGFKNVFLMGDHGGGQRELGEVARKLDLKYRAKGIRIYHCNEMYDKAEPDYWKWLADHNYPSGGHGSIMDTSEMLYLSTRGNTDLAWVRKDLIKSALGDPVKPDPNTPRINNGITGDARQSTPELGKRIFDMKVDYAVNQMKRFTASPK